MQRPATPPSSTSRARDLDAAEVARAHAGAQLDGHRQAAAACGGARQRDRAAGSSQQRRAGARLAHLRHGAAHVEVDQVGAGRRDALGRGRHHVGIVSRTAAPRPDAHRGGSAAARGRCARCGSARRSSRPSPRRPARRRGAWPAGARTSCRSRPAARARRGWGSATPPRRPAVGERAQGRVASDGVTFMVRIREWTSVPLVKPVGRGRARAGARGRAVRRPHAPRPERSRRDEADPEELLDGAEHRPARAARSCSRCTSPTATRRPTTWCIEAAPQVRRAAHAVLPGQPPRRRPVAEAERCARRRRERASSCTPAPSSSRSTIPQVRELVALAHERELPMLIHAGRGIPALGMHAVRAGRASSPTRG